MTTAMYCLTNATNSQQYCQGDQVVGKTVLVMENLQKANKLASYPMLALLVYCWLPSASTISIGNKALGRVFVGCWFNIDTFHIWYIITCFWGIPSSHEQKLKRSVDPK